MDTLRIVTEFSLFRTCSQVHEEAYDYLCKIYTFRFLLGDDFSFNDLIWHYDVERRYFPLYNLERKMSLAHGLDVTRIHKLRVEILLHKEPSAVKWSGPKDFSMLTKISSLKQLYIG